MAHIRLGELLLSAGIIDEEQLQRALELQKGSRQRLGEVMISHGIITEEQMIEALQKQLGIESIDLTKTNIPVELAQVLPKRIALQYQVVPVRIVKDELFLAMSDPLNFYALEDVRKAVKKKIIPMAATVASIRHAIAILYGNEGAAKAIEEMKKDAALTTDEGLGDNTAFISNQLGEDAASAPTIRLVNSIIERAITEHASDIHLEPREKEFVVRMRVDGLMRSILTVPKNLQNSVIARIKIISGMDTSERRIPQDGRFNVRLNDKELDLRVSSLPTVYGEKIVARLLDKTAGKISKESIGLTGEDLKKYEKMIHCHSGVILIVGPTGSGKSTTMYTMIHELNTDDVNFVTLEDPVEYNISGVNQVQINEKTGLTFAAGLRSILRQDPDIIAVGEIRDGETAEIAMRSAITGHVVLSTIHTNDAVGTVERLQDMGCESYLISSALRGVISQRLVRKICPDCREKYVPGEEELHNMGIAPGTKMSFYRGKGCPHCFDSGYRGRTAVFEIMPVTEKVRRIIGSNGRREELEAALHDTSSGFVSMKENAMRLVREGITTPDEIMRVILSEE